MAICNSVVKRALLLISSCAEERWGGDRLRGKGSRDAQLGQYGMTFGMIMSLFTHISTIGGGCELFFNKGKVNINSPTPTNTKELQHLLTLPPHNPKCSLLKT